jgi:hypothetical protein
MAPSKLAWKIATRSSEMSVAPTERSELGDDPGICRLIVKRKGMEVSVSGHQPALSVSMSCLSSTASEPGCQAWLTYG